MEFATVVLAAGQGKRLHSSIPKVLHPLAGKPLLHHVLDTALALQEQVIVVLGHKADRVRTTLPDSVMVVDQGEPRGTGHAMQRVLEDHADLPSNLLILSGDVPLIQEETLRDLMETHSRFESTLTVLTCELEDPGYYGRILRDGDGKVTAIREFSDATPEELKTREVNTGIYIMSTEYLRKVLPGIGMTNVQGELYLTDTIEAAIQEGRVVSPLRLADHREMQGINTRADLARVHRYYYERVHERLMDSGVTILDPEHTYIDHQTTVGRDTIIHPGVVLARSHLGSACVIHAHSVITDCAIGDETAVLPSSVLTESTMGQACSIGPFAHMRPGCILGDRVRFGNFVEGKKANLADGVKAGHLTYLGDCTVGQNVNIGCGTITCNYDGTRKHQTIIEEGVFIGSDTQLVAPVTVGKDAYVGAGSTITQDVPPGALAVARSKQRNIPGWVLKRKEKS